MSVQGALWYKPAPRKGKPRPGLGIERRAGDERMALLLARISDPATLTAVAAERALLAMLDGSCRTPIAGHAVSDGETLRFFGMILTPDGSRFHRISAEGKAGDAAGIGEKAGTDIRAVAGADFFTSWT